jgi:hypothetical protein
MISRGKQEKYSEKNQLHCEFVHDDFHKSHRERIPRLCGEKPAYSGLIYEIAK